MLTDFTRAGASGCSLLVRNLSRSVRIEDLRYTAEKYGRLRDVYIPKDYYTGCVSASKVALRYQHAAYEAC